MYTPYNSIQDKIIEIEQVSTIMLLLCITGYNNSIVIVDFFFCVCGQCHNTAWEKNCSGVIMI